MARTRRLAVFAATSGHSGVDRNLRNLVPAFAARGVAVDVLHIKNHGPNLTDLPDNARVVELGVAHVHTSLFALSRYLRAARPDALLADKDKVNRTALLARRLARVPTRIAVRLGIHVSTNLAQRSLWQRWVQTQSIRRYYPKADVIVVPSDGVADDLAALGRLARARITVIPNPIVTPALLTRAAESPGHPWFEDATIPVVLGVGELSERKDFETLIRAVSLVRRSRPCRLVILGRGKQRETLLALGARLGLADHMDLPGFVDNPYAYMRRAAVFANTSRLEGFANVVAEALAVGTPVVATDCHSGPREILEHGRNGKLVPVGDAEALALAILATLADPPLPERLRSAAARYSIDTIADRYLEALGLNG